MTIAQKISDCLLGAFVADAASMGVEWIYDPSQMRETVDSLETPEFKNPPSPNYFSASEFPGHYEAGMLSPYGEQMLWVAEYFAKEGYDGTKDDMFASMKEWAKTFGGRPDHALATAIGQGRGADDDQAHCFTKAVVATCLHLGSPQRHEKVEEAIRVHQENDIAVAIGLALSNILNALVFGKDLKTALEPSIILNGIDHKVAKQAVDDAHAAVKSQKSLEDVAAERGRSCHLPESFIIPLQACLQATTTGSSDSNDAYAIAIRKNILASGDVCSRSIMIGAILGLAYGGCPESFATRFDSSQKKRVENAAEAISKQRMSASLHNLMF